MIYPIYIIAAADQNSGIGKDGDMPWRLKGDLLHFQKITTQTEDKEKKNIVIMGRKTWESLPPKSRPLTGRKNIVITRSKDYKAEGAEIVESLENAFSKANSKTEKIFIIGGGMIYREGMKLKNLTGIYLTEIRGKFDCDTFFPEIPKRFSQKKELGAGEENKITYNFLLYTTE